MTRRPLYAMTTVGLLTTAVACVSADRAEEVTAGMPVVEGVSGPALPLAAPSAAHMSAERLARIGPAMQAYIDDGRLPGVMTLVARGGEIVHWEAVGMSDLESAELLQPDDIFRIYSMTKPITSTAIMILVEGGDIALDDPVSKFIPEFSELSVLEEDGSRTPVSPPVTIQHLLSHSGGLTYGIFGDTPVDQAYVAANLFQAQSLEDYVATVAGLPLLAQPGTIWNYSVSTDLLGYIVQTVSGQPFEVFLRERIFEPLQMDDTAFWVPEDKRDRFTNHYAVGDDGLQLVDSRSDGSYTRPPEFASGGGGLVSTASDYLRFAQMILQRGYLDDVRILQPETVVAMGTNVLADGVGPINVAGWFPPAYGFGLGFATLTDEDLTSAADHDGLIRWGGVANTFFWIDPGAELVAMVWTQADPFLVHRLEGAFEELVYDALETVTP